jgi:hypothetical protein
LTEDVEEPDSLEELAHPGCRAHDLQQTVRLNRRVVGTDQCAHAPGVDSRDTRQVQHDHAFAALEEITDVAAQIVTDRRSKRTFETKHTPTVRAGSPEYGQRTSWASERLVQKRQVVIISHWGNLAFSLAPPERS